MQSAVKFDVAHSNILDNFTLVILLSNAAHGNTKAVVELRVSDLDVGAVCCDRNTVIAIVHDPVVGTRCERNVSCRLRPY